jgi:hypothetical protein
VTNFIFAIFFNAAPVMTPPPSRPPAPLICKHGHCPSHPPKAPAVVRPGNTGGRK